MTTITIPLTVPQLLLIVALLIVLVPGIVDTVQAWREDRPRRVERRLIVQRLGGVPWWRRMVKR